MSETSSRRKMVGLSEAVFLLRKGRRDGEMEMGKLVEDISEEEIYWLDRSYRTS